MDMTRTLTTRVTGDLRPLRRTLSSMRGMLAVSAGAVAAVAVGAIAKATAAAVTFESEMAGVRGMLGDISDADFARLTGQVRSLAKEFGLTHTEAARIAYQLGSQQIPTDQIDAYGRAVAGLAKVLRVADAGIAGEALLRPMEAYGKGVKDLEHVQDVIAGIVQQGQMTGQEAAQYMPMWTAEAANLGVAWEEAGAAFANATKQMTVDRAATGMRAMLTTLAKSNEAMDQFGGGGDLVKRLGLVGAVEYLGKMAGGDAKKMAEFFPEARAKAFALAVVNLSAKMKAGTQQLMTDAGAYERMLTPIMATREQELARLKALFTDMGIEMGNTLLPVIGEMATSMQAWMDVPENLERVKAAGENLANIFQAVGVAVGVAVEKLSSLYNVGKKLNEITGLGDRLSAAVEKYRKDQIAEAGTEATAEQKAKAREQRQLAIEQQYGYGSAEAKEARKQAYLGRIKDKYGEDSAQYRKAVSNVTEIDNDTARNIWNDAAGADAAGLEAAAGMLESGVPMTETTAREVLWQLRMVAENTGRIPQPLVAAR